ncbi:MAG: nucleoside-diphosphate sugar epimerase/dehydratase [Pseudomonadota bacterium]
MAHTPEHERDEKAPAGRPRTPADAPRWLKQVLQALLDAASLTLVSFSIPWIMGASIFVLPFIPQQQAFVAIYVTLGCLLLWSLRFYRIVLRRLDTAFVTQLVYAGIGLAVIATLLYLERTNVVKATALGVVIASLSIGLIASTRLATKFIVARFEPGAGTAEPVLIYGAGQAGHALAEALRGDQRFAPVAFLDDDPALTGLRISGLRVHHGREVDAVRARYGTGRVVLAIPSLGPKRRRDVMERLVDMGVEVLSVPTYSDLVAGTLEVSNLRRVDVADLLGRDVVDLAQSRLHKWFEGRTVLITGAGGTIGAEMARQIAGLSPARLILLDASEPALYTIHQELATEAGTTEVIPVLASVTDADRIGAVFAKRRIDAVFHAAAYKHVPIVEENALAGLENNVLGTDIVAEAAGRAKVQRFILVSTDKAVRPTNVMGASKRLAELCTGAAQDRHAGTIYSLVRFGNVLGSSGSVVPLFQRQIHEGGPVTVTHPEIIRYFMTIPEAAQLVVTAGLQANGGEVFVLDMGEPVRILDLAQRMIRLSGTTERSGTDQEGEIEIRFTGLRPGEKLYEELLIDDTTVETPHPKIFCAREARLPASDVARIVAALRTAIRHGDLDGARAIVEAALPDYTPSDHVTDIAVRPPSVQDAPAFGAPHIVPGGKT